MAPTIGIAISYVLFSIVFLHAAISPTSSSSRSEFLRRKRDLNSDGGPSSSVWKKYTEFIFQKYDGIHNSNNISLEELEKHLKNIGLDAMNHDDADHVVDEVNGLDPEKSRQKRYSTSEGEDDAQHNCSSVKSLLSEYGIQDLSSGLSPQQYHDLCPALLFRLDSGACDHLDQHGHHLKVEKGRNMALVWLYMMLLVLAISLCAVFGIFFIPKKSSSVYNRIIQFLMALAAGTMAGDGMLHLLPHAMSSHEEHDDHDHDDHHEDDGHHDAAHTNSLLKGLVAMMGVYAFFFLERGFAIYKYREERKQRAKDQHENALHMLPDSDNHHTHSHGAEGLNGQISRRDSSSRKQLCKCPTLTPLALMILLGDFFHNFCDGLAIGAAFASSTTIGLSTSIAVFCHELPHEIGDFAVLIKSGLTKKEAVALNFLSALSCFIGAVVGIFLGDFGTAPLWIFALVGGMFMYIALVDLVPEMTSVYLTDGEEWPYYLAMHAAGLLCGTTLMFIIGWYEHDISGALD